nr:hypothetical protein [Tanacetum cinerariifolium]
MAAAATIITVTHHFYLTPPPRHTSPRHIFTISTPTPSSSSPRCHSTTFNHHHRRHLQPTSSPPLLLPRPTRQGVCLGEQENRKAIRLCLGEQKHSYGVFGITENDKGCVWQIRECLVVQLAPAGGKLRDLNAKEYWALLEDLALYDNESWNEPTDFTKSGKAITSPQDVPITTSSEICSGPHDTQYCMEDLEQAIVEYASSRTDEAGGLVSNFMESKDAILYKFEADFKQQQSEMTNKIDTVLKAITDRIDGALPSYTAENPNLSTSPVLSSHSNPTINPQCSSLPSTLVKGIKAYSKEANVLKTSLPQNRVGIKTQQPEEPKPTLEDEFQDLQLNLPVLEVLAHPLIYNAILDKYVKNLELGKHGSSFIQGEVIDMKKDPETPLLVGRGFLAIANAVIDYRMAKIVVGKGITREWEIARDVKLNHFKDTLVFRRMDKPPKNKDGEWHAKIRLIDMDEEEFTKTLQSISTIRKLFKRESTREIIDLDHLLYFMRRSSKVLRKFYWMILRGRFNQLSHVSCPLLSKLGEY